MKIFRNLKTLALVALAGVASLVVSCDPVEDNPPVGGNTVETLVFQMEGNDVFFAAGEEKTIAVAENQTVDGATVVAPEGWEVVASAAGLEIKAPTQASVDEGVAEAAGKVEVSVETSNKVYEGVLYVFMGDTVIYVEATSATFNDIQVKAVIKGVDMYMIHIGTEGAWKSSFDEWQNPNPMLPETPMFGWEGEYYDTTFEGSLFTFAKDPYVENFMAMPGVTYDLAILPIVEGKALADYSYSDVYLYAFKTAKAGENGTVSPEFSLAGQTYNEVSVDVTATDAYVTFWTFYKAKEYEEIGGREKVIKENLITMGEQNTEAQFTATKSNLAQGEKVYLAAISLDKDGNYGELVIDEFYSGSYPFNDMTVTLGEITWSSNGKTIYIPVSVEGGELDYYRYAYVSNSSTWAITYGGSIEKAEVYIANVENEYYGPKFVEPEELVDGQIVISSGVAPGLMGRILVLATDTQGGSSHAAYAECTTSDSQYQVVYKEDEGYEYGMPNVAFKNVTSEKLQDGTTKYWVNFTITLAEGTDTAYVCVAGEDYLEGRTPYTMLFSEMGCMTNPNTFMYNQAFTSNGVFNADSMYCYNDVSRSAVYVAWKDDNGKYHETKLFYEPVEDAQPHLPALQ